MFLVTGAKRSGTSMWMQILTAAGLPAVGEAFPKSWGDGPLREANPRGFFESTLRDGIAWHTNPDPRTGFYLHPDAARGHCVKVFLPGLARTDLAFVEGALLTVRDWRTQIASVAQLAAQERRAAGEDLPEAAVRPTAAHALEWWLEMVIGLRDLLARGYPAHLVSHEAVLAQPEVVVPQVLGWLGVPALDVDAAIQAVDRSLERSVPAGKPPGLDPGVAQLMDELVSRIQTGAGLDEDLLRRIDQAHQDLAPTLREHLAQAAAAQPGPA